MGRALYFGEILRRFNVALPLKPFCRMFGLRPNSQRARTAIALIYAVLVMEIVSLVSGFFQYNLLHNIDLGQDVSTAAAEANDTRESLIGILYLIVYVVSAVTFIQWFRRAYFNLHQRIHDLSYTEGWAAGSWFVPILCLFRPYQIMRELYRATGQLTRGKEAGTGVNLSTNFLGLWWALWVISNVLGQFNFRLTMHSESLDMMITTTIIGMILNALGIPLAFAAVKVIRDYSRVEPLLIEESKRYDDEGFSNEFALAE
jgi:hypothetical protein